MGGAEAMDGFTWACHYCLFNIASYAVNKIEISLDSRPADALIQFLTILSATIKTTVTADLPASAGSLPILMQMVTDELDRRTAFDEPIVFELVIPEPQDVHFELIALAENLKGLAELFKSAKEYRLGVKVALDIADEIEANLSNFGPIA